MVVIHAHIVIADENYFSTLFMNSPYCEDLVRKNFMFLLFDKWENEKNSNSTHRDTRKCLSPDVDSCGRSPTTLTLEYMNLLRISKALFARKFDPEIPESMALVDLIDDWRSREESLDKTVVSGDEGNMFMIKWNNSATISSHNSADLCWEMAEDDSGILLQQCNPMISRQWLTLGDVLIVNYVNNTHYFIMS